MCAPLTAYENLIRQYTWRDWYRRHPDVVATPADMRGTDVASRMHVDHCIEALRLTLMCHGDTTPYFVIEDESAPLGKKADFSPHHTCRNFAKIATWTEDNQLIRPPGSNWRVAHAESRQLGNTGSKAFSDARCCSQARTDHQFPGRQDAAAGYPRSPATRPR